jgi:hypothetical protein
MVSPIPVRRLAPVTRAIRPRSGQRVSLGLVEVGFSQVVITDSGGFIDQ